MKLEIHKGILLMISVYKVDSAQKVRIHARKTLPYIRFYTNYFYLTIASAIHYRGTFKGLNSNFLLCFSSQNWV